MVCGLTDMGCGDRWWRSGWGCVSEHTGQGAGQLLPKVAQRACSRMCADVPSFVLDFRVAGRS